MAFFDATLFTVVARLYRALDGALDPPASRRGGGAATDSGRTGTRRPRVGPYLRWGSWIGGDRDGNPEVTADISERTLRIHAEHVLHGYEAVATRLMQTTAAASSPERMPRHLASRLARDAETLPEIDRQVRRRFPDEPYRQRFGFIAERLRRTRAALTGEAAPLTGRYATPDELDEELEELQEALAGDGLERVAWGEVADLRWQLGTFGFHLASLEIRQHAVVHRAALEVLRAQGAAADTAVEVSTGVPLDEVTGTFRSIAAIQARHGVEACHRVVVSFTASASDVTDVLELAGLATDDTPPVLDVVPLFETTEALAAAGPILEAMLGDPRYRAHLAGRGDRQEAMLGYSDSNKESGFLAAAWMLHQAQEGLIAVARAKGIELTLFHGRGGAIGRGGGPTNRAILGQAPGSVDGRLKLTEQGEVIAANYSDPVIARRHLEQVTAAVMLASTPEHDARLATAVAVGRPIMDELAATSREAYRALVHDDADFASFFRDVTPIAELSDLRLGSRPAARGRIDGAPSIDSLRAIPWTFAWSQSRINLPGWYGLGTALDRYRTVHGEGGLDAVARLARDWPFLRSLVDNAEMSLAKADMGVARLYAALGQGEGDAGRWATHRDRIPPHGRDAAPDHRSRPAARRCTGPPALDRAAESLCRFALRAPGPPARTAPHAAARGPGTRSGAPPRPADRQRRGGRPPEHRVTARR